MIASSVSVTVRASLDKSPKAPEQDRAITSCSHLLKILALKVGWKVSNFWALEPWLCGICADGSLSISSPFVMSLHYNILIETSWKSYIVAAPLQPTFWVVVQPLASDVMPYYGGCLCGCKPLCKRHSELLPTAWAVALELYFTLPLPMRLKSHLKETPLGGQSPCPIQILV